MTDAEHTSGFRILLLMLGSIAIISGLMLRLYYLQVIKADSMKDRSKPQRTYYLSLPPTRGMLLDRNWRTLAANAKQTGNYIVMLDKKRSKNVSETVRNVGAILNLEETEMERHITALTQPDVKARDLKRNVSEEMKTRLIEADIPGIVLRDQPGRFYPEGRLACHLIGFTGKDNKGWAGLEYVLDDKLEVAERVILAEKDQSRRMLADEDLTTLMNQRVDVVLTIDSYIQYVVERELQKVWEECEAEDANAVVLHAKTGEILAMATVPNYDPNTYQDSPLEARKNRLLAETFEPGSILKPFTIIAALDKKKDVVTPNTIFDCENGSYYFAGNTIRDDIHRFGKLSVRDILVRSSNIGTVKIAQTLGNNADDYKNQAAYLYDYLRRFGFKDKQSGDPNTTELPYEHSGILPPPNKWHKSRIGAVPFGQAIATNTMILAGAYAAVANRGLYVSPHAIKGYRDVDGIFYPREQAPPVRIVSQSVIEQVVDMMVAVTEDPEGTGTRVRIPGFHIAGKTGTAQKAINGEYVKGKRVASFAGFFPAENPQFVIIVVVDEPRKKKYGAEVAGPTWKTIAEELIAYWGITPTYPSDPMLAAKTPRAEGKRNERERKTDAASHIALQLFGVNGAMQIPSQWHRSHSPDIMPNLLGRTLREAYVELAINGLYAQFVGNGKVVMQEIAAGTELKNRQHVGVIHCEPILTDSGVTETFTLLAKN
jgi:cell division protein FtsI (penicillin-binding protein 3)